MVDMGGEGKMWTLSEGVWVCMSVCVCVCVCGSLDGLDLYTMAKVESRVSLSVM